MLALNHIYYVAFQLIRFTIELSIYHAVIGIFRFIKCIAISLTQISYKAKHETIKLVFIDSIQSAYYLPDQHMY